MASLLEAVEEVNTAKNPYADMICEQRFEDTSLKKQNEEELQTIMQKSGKLELADLGDLVLWNILGYATDSETFLFLLQVSKEWKQYVFIIIPLPILRIRFDYRKYDRPLPFNAGTIRSLCHWCYLKDSVLYRGGKTRSLRAKDTKDGIYELKKDEDWSSLQPQFMCEMYSYIYNLCTQRTPCNWSSPVYEEILSWCNETSIDSVQKMKESFLNEQSIQSNISTPFLLIKKFNARMKYLINCFQTIDRVIGYLNRFYVQHHAVPTVLIAAMNKLAEALDICKDSMRQLKTTISIAPGLLKDCTSEEISTFFTFSNLISHLNAEEYEMAIELLLKTSKTDQKKSSTSYENKDGIIQFITEEGDLFELSREQLTHVSEFSGTMKALMLMPGDKIRIPTKSKVFGKALEFCKYHHENGPMEAIETPIQSPNMADFVSEWDAGYIDSIDQEMLFEIILVANHFDIPSLLDLGCAKVAAMITGKTPEEIRQTFNIVNDFTPEEEAQVREENKWTEEA